MAWFTIVVAAIPAFYSIRGSWLRSRSPHRFWKFVLDALQLKITREKPPNAPPQPKPAHLRTFSAGTTSSATTSDLDRKVTEKAPAEAYQNVEPRPLALAKALLVPLTDVQIIVGLAYIVTGVSLTNKISFYHEQIVTNLWWLTLNSLWVSRIDYNENIPEMRQWRFQIRRLAILTSVLLSTVFQAIVAFREKAHWSATQNGRCYVGAGLGSDFGDNMFWLIGTAIYAFVLILGSWSRTRIWFDEKVLERVEPSMVAMWGWTKGSLKELKAARAETKTSGVSFIHRIFKLVFLAAKAGCFSLAFLTWWCLIQFLAIWSSGVGSPVVEMIVYSGFALESTIWVIYLKVNNRVLILPTGTEDKWTFGQMLPITLLVLILFYWFDAEYSKSLSNDFVETCNTNRLGRPFKQATHIARHGTGMMSTTYLKSVNILFS
jgi:hypothetical protein